MMSVAGSAEMPFSSRSFRAIRSRTSIVPAAGVYRVMFFSMASMAACFTASGQLKFGSPMVNSRTSSPRRFISLPRFISFTVGEP